MDNTELAERDREGKEIERKKKEMTMDEILRCPTWDCKGGPEVWCTGVETPVGQIWCVGCPVCGGWVSQFISKGDPYTEGTRLWEGMRKEMGH